ncbi:hypothetical protein NEOLI_000303, partial [Neolecta irregularis DAH-3]
STAIAASWGASILIFLLFCFLRPRHNVVYAPKLKLEDNEEKAPPKAGTGFFDWVKPVWSYQEDDLYHKIGVDSLVFLRFHRMMRITFFLFAALGCFVVIPMNIGINLGTAVGRSKRNKDPLSLCSIQTVSGNLLWIYILFAWLFIALFLWILYVNYQGIIRLRTKYFQSSEYQNSLHSRTLLVYDIPQDLRSDEGIMRIAHDYSYGLEFVQAQIGRNVNDIPELIARHKDAIQKEEKILAKYLKNPNRLPAVRPTCCPKGRNEHVDAIDYYMERIQVLEQKIELERRTIDKQSSVSYVAKANRNKHPKGMTIKLSPRPEDIIWDNIKKPKRLRNRNRAISFAFFVILCLVWQIPNSLISTFIANLYLLGSIWPAFQTQLNRHRNFWATVQGIASPALVATFFLILPTIMRRITRREGILSKSSRERHVVHKLYIFLTLNNFIIFTILGMLWNFVVQMIKITRDQHIPFFEAVKDFHLIDNLAFSFMQVSGFWITYIIQRNLSSLFDLCQLVNLLWLSVKPHIMTLTPREKIELSRPPVFDFASYYNYSLFYTTVSICYALIQPLILPFALVYFSIACMTYKYCLMYIFSTKVETGGGFWRVLFNRIIFALCLMVAIYFAVIWNQYDFLHAAFILPLGVIIIIFKIYCLRTFDPLLDFYLTGQKRPGDSGYTLPVAKSGSDDRRNRLQKRFGHPALSERLWTPMVASNARAVLPHVYRGRVSDIEDNENFMSGRKGGIDGKFELVEERNMDFQAFHNREDFGAVNSDYTTTEPPSRTGTPFNETLYGGFRDMSPHPDYLHPSRGGTPFEGTPRSGISQQDDTYFARGFPQHDRANTTGSEGFYPQQNFSSSGLDVVYQTQTGHSDLTHLLNENMPRPQNREGDRRNNQYRRHRQR